MLCSKDVYLKHFDRVTKSVIFDKNKTDLVINTIKTRYGIPFSISTDILTEQIERDLIDEFFLFAVEDCISPDSIKQYFTDVEINRHSSTKYEVEKIKFPIKWNMIKVSENQWIGSISAQEIMLLRNEHMINYNPNTQRTLTRIVRGGKETFKITLSKKTVKSIMELMRVNHYIPDPITLNLPEDSEFSFSDNVLTIKSLNAFDILDGYHRYIALSNLINEDPEFNYNMELRITCFPEETAKQFIWQKSQKTKMSKIDSDSYNQDNAATQIVNMLNRGIFSELVVIHGTIDASVMREAVELAYNTKSISKKEIIEIRNAITEAMNYVVETKPEMMETKWEASFIFALVYLLKNELPIENVWKLNDLIDKNHIMYGRRMRKKAFDSIKNLM